MARDGGSVERECRRKREREIGRVKERWKEKEREKAKYERERRREMRRRERRTEASGVRTVGGVGRWLRGRTHRRGFTVSEV